ncbi:hypothetical protein [Jeotgalibacillus aurantiacus]|uniref:hypothetical protein n=1 Tax=Jeotgalibacillus aurantiacus TaxID=2763266 RepID=UPI001D0B0831|nr:hypothetical protein [Jeotgalibacillus aurantiacus]
MNILTKHLSKDQKIAINLYIQRYARPVERAFHQFRQGEGSHEAVIHALESYQNEDGGFGHALEADSRLIDSTVLDTTVALQYLMQLPIEADHPMVVKAMHYLIAQYDRGKKLFPIVPATVNHVPRAPWWNVNEETGETGFEKIPGNPGAEILGYLHRCRSHMSDEITADLEVAMTKRLHEIDQWDMHEIQCYYRLAELTHKGELRDQIIQKIADQAHTALTKTSEEWEGYGLQPLKIVQRTQSPLYSVMEDLVEENARWYADRLTKEGYWNPSWEWGQYPVEWERAKKDWRSYLTVNACHPPHYLLGE